MIQYLGKEAVNEWTAFHRDIPRGKLKLTIDCNLRF